ncbi:uncharacterized protein LOC142092282 [Calonectris borealis]|uniref:uncharacterized protein LOC142092282 n=1 Tax=Calonectris borealis TaxID=1323832 RepID=UPI003F4C6242
MKVLLVLAVLLTCSVFTARGKLPRTFTPGLEGSTVGNLTAHGCYSGWGSSGTSTASMDRCCLLRACCYAKLAARRCRVRPTQPLLVPRAGIPTCSESPQSQLGMPLSRPPPSFAVPFFRAAPGDLPEKKVSDVLSLRSLQDPGPGAREVPADASGQPGSAGCAAGGCSGVAASAGDEPGGVEAKGLFAKPPPSCCVIIHWIRGGRAAQMQCFSTEKQGTSGHLCLVPAKGEMEASASRSADTHFPLARAPRAACQLPLLCASLRILFCCSKIKPEHAKHQSSV